MTPPRDLGHPSTFKGCDLKHLHKKRPPRARSRAARARAASIFGCLSVRLHVSAHEARRRGATRTAYITCAEFTHLHDQDPDDPPPADHDLDVTDLTIDEQVAAVTALWRKSS